jgi:hypothetical protein
VRGEKSKGSPPKEQFASNDALLPLCGGGCRFVLARTQGLFQNRGRLPLPAQHNNSTAVRDIMSAFCNARSGLKRKFAGVTKGGSNLRVTAAKHGSF